MLALNLYTTPSNNGGIVLYLDADLGDLTDLCSLIFPRISDQAEDRDDEVVH